ncbi:hypothetical protein OG280_21700 [Streptomyces virginiae]|uniref:hypothetical protein n=1 Tax=Streptomyces virginiae TaxID=1961 RepID=UPI002DD8B2A0|nr:hypothetical protein [Streptomyces virginiae]WSC78310.1 hypothetical protein OHA56_19405 [Streptomyces virginiae]
MSELPDFHSAIVYLINADSARATLPFQRANRAEQYATAFWFDELVKETAEGAVVRQYLVTAGEPTRVETAEITLRQELCSPAMSAEKLAMTGFAEGWIHLGDLGVAVMPDTPLYAYAARKGWSWTTDEITDGVAATEEDIAALDGTPVPAYLLGHPVDAENGAREQALVVGEIVRTDEDGVRWVGTLPQGCVGAPVFIGARLGENSFKLVCVGVALPGEGPHPIATFDRIRAALLAVAPERRGDVPATAAEPRSAVPKRRWWRRRG